uniref:RHS repeat domain-containing protein n=1 Tax=Saccharothrix violaceirubra TaxID=413306 RepID=UPI0028AAF5D6|nr:RHS repeat domain-containing protein [Saccharothrix violaceirubra]
MRHCPRGHPGTHFGRRALRTRRAGPRRAAAAQAAVRKPDTRHYRRDADDRLVAVTTPDGTNWSYRHDPLGHRVERRARPHRVPRHRVPRPRRHQLLPAQRHPERLRDAQRPVGPEPFTGARHGDRRAARQLR